MRTSPGPIIEQNGCWPTSSRPPCRSKPSAAAAASANRFCPLDREVASTEHVARRRPRVASAARPAGRAALELREHRRAAAPSSSRARSRRAARRIARPRSPPRPPLARQPEDPIEPRRERREVVVPARTRPTSAAPPPSRAPTPPRAGEAGAARLSNSRRISRTFTAAGALRIAHERRAFDRTSNSS